MGQTISTSPSPPPPPSSSSSQLPLLLSSQTALHNAQSTTPSTTILLGPPGTGKTTALQSLLHTTPSSSTNTIYKSVRNLPPHLFRAFLTLHLPPTAPSSSPTPTIHLLLDDLSDAPHQTHDLLHTLLLTLRTTNHTPIPPLSLTLSLTTPLRPGRPPLPASTIRFPSLSHSDALSLFISRADMHPSAPHLLPASDLFALDRILHLCAGDAHLLVMAAAALTALRDARAAPATALITGLWSVVEAEVRLYGRGDLCYVLINVAMRIAAWRCADADAEHEDDETEQEVSRVWLARLAVFKQAGAVHIPIPVLKRLWTRDEPHLQSVLDRFLAAAVLRRDPDCDTVLTVRKEVWHVCARIAAETTSIPNLHARFLTAYRDVVADGSTTSIRQWWRLRPAEHDQSYMLDNTIHHLVESGALSEAVNLVSDFRWVRARLSQPAHDNTLLPFQNDIIQLLPTLSKRQDPHISNGLRDLLHTVRKCASGRRAAPTNLQHFTYELYARLVSRRSSRVVVTRMIASILKFATRPWVRAGLDVLPASESGLHEVKEVYFDAVAVTAGHGFGDGFVLLGSRGQVRVFDEAGREVWALEGFMASLRMVCVGGEGVYGSCVDGRVIYSKRGSVSRFRIGMMDGEKVSTMTFAHSVVLGLTSGRVLVLDECGAVYRAFQAHSGEVSHMSGCQTRLLTASARNVTVWEAYLPVRTFHCHRSVVCTAMSHDGRFMAYALSDGNIQIYSSKTHSDTSTPPDTSIQLTHRSVNSLTIHQGILHAAVSNKIIRHNIQTNLTLPSLIHDPSISITSLTSSQTHLHALSPNTLFIWNPSAIEPQPQQHSAQTTHHPLSNFALSPLGTTLATTSRNHITIRHLQTSATNIQQTRVDIPSGNLAVSDHGRYIIFAHPFDNLQVFVIDVLQQRQHMLDDAAVWLSQTVSGRRRHEARVAKVAVKAGIVSAIVSLGAENGTAARRRFLWRVSDMKYVRCEDGGDHDDTVGQRDTGRKKKGGKKKGEMRLFCEKLAFEYSPCVELTDGPDGDGRHVATLEHHPRRVAFHGGRLWVLSEAGQIQVLDLMGEEKKEEDRSVVVPVVEVEEGDARSSEDDDDGEDGGGEVVVSEWVSAV